MLQMLIAAPNSGSGKTTVTIALLAALKARGLNPCAFKSGPDYIDSMFHRSVLGVESHNLDLFFSKPQIVQNLYNKTQPITVLLYAKVLWGTMTVSAAQATSQVRGI